jgi:hypothetical protein
MSLQTDEGHLGERLLIALGGILLAMSLFLGWVHVIIIGDLDHFQLLALSRGSPYIAWGTSVIGLVIAIVTLMTATMKPIRTLSLIVGLVGGLIGGEHVTQTEPMSVPRRALRHPSINQRRYR